MSNFLTTGLFDWFPSYSQSGPFTVTIGAANPHNQTATESFIINVQKVDLPPVLNASDQNFIIGQSSSFTLGATTPEEFARYMREGREKWDRLIRQLNIPIEG